ncbi:MAG: DNA repair protein RecO [Petrimonas sp.]|nr:DNA repair protein RecO [Petrimonas sp.]MEA4981007.1 DNA repair protein RecO [Petrimonas sp.]
MYHKTEGIVLSNAKYNDKYVITHVFTRDFGRVSYLLPKTHGRRSKINPALFSPLSILNLEVEHLPLREIQRLKEADRQALLYNIGSDLTKVSLVFFLSEFLSKVLRETDNNEVLFDYLKQAVEVLEETKAGLANFHLTFILGLTRFLGIYPNLENYTKGCCFDMLNGEFTCRIPTHNYYLRDRESAYLNELSRINFSNMHLFNMSRSDRNLIIDRLLTYYRLHLYDFPAIKSLDVLRELF